MSDKKKRTAVATWISAGKIWIALIVLFSGSAGIVIALYRGLDAGEQVKLKGEIAKAFLQLAVVAIVGGIVKWLFDQHATDRERDARLNEFRVDTVGRLIAANSQVRKAPALIEAARSAKTYGEQMVALIDSRLELSLIRHDVETTRKAFSNYDLIQERIRHMEGYLEDLTKEYRDHYKKLSDLQSKSPEQVWKEIESLEKLTDLRNGGLNSTYYNNYVANYFLARDMMRREIWASVGITATSTPRSSRGSDQTATEAQSSKMES